MIFGQGISFTVRYFILFDSAPLFVELGIFRDKKLYWYFIPVAAFFGALGERTFQEGHREQTRLCHLCSFWEAILFNKGL